MRFERLFRLAVLAGAATAWPGMAMAVPVTGAVLQSAPQSAEDYQWIDRADALWDAIGDAPPDFAFPFEGAEPWAWQTADGYTIIVEDAGEGGIRSYYFAPGARGPFLAVEPGMSFGYDGARLAMVYDADGEAAPRSEFGDYDDAAGDMYERALRLRDALSGRDYRPVDTEAWIDTSPLIFSFIQTWDIGRSRYPDWAHYHARSDAAAWRRRFEAEQRRRRALALRFNGWRNGGFKGPPPGRFHHRPDGPNRPGAGRPPQPGSGWSRPPGGGRPGQPGRPGRPGGPGAPGTNPPPRPGMPIVAPDAPGGGSRPPMTRPGNRPDGTTGWRRGRPNPPVPGAATPNPGGAPAVPDARPLPNGNRWGRPSQGMSRPGWSRPDRPERGWQGSTPPTGVPAPASPGAGGAAPSRPNWGRPSRPEGWQRPTPPAPPSAAPAPGMPSTGTVAPARPNWGRPSRPEGWQRPAQAVAPSAPPAATAPAPRPAWSRPDRPEGGWQRPPAPVSRPAPAPSPPPAAAPRPSPPPQAAPAPRPSNPSATPRVRPGKSIE